MLTNDKWLFLDDFREPQDAFRILPYPEYNKVDWVTVRSYDEFVAWITENGMPHTISFDHDLADSHYSGMQHESIDYDNCIEKTGYHCAQWLVEYCQENDCKLPEIVWVHSQNPYGRENIRQYMFNAKKHLML